MNHRLCLIVWAAFALTLCPSLLADEEPSSEQIMYQEYLQTLLDQESRFTAPIYGISDIYVDLSQATLPEDRQQQRDLSSRVLFAEWLAQRSQWPEAETAFREVLALSPQSPDVNTALARAIWSQGRFQEAADLLQRLSTENPTHSESRRLLGDVLSQTGQHQGAVEAYREALELRPHDDEVRLDLATELMELDENEEALEHLRTLRSSSPSNLYAVMLLADLSQRMGNIDEAIECLEIVIDSRPDYMPPYLLMSNLVAEHRGADEALEVIKRGLLRQPTSPELNLALRRLLGDDDSGAVLEWWEEFAAEQEGNADLQMAYVARLLAAREEERAVVALERIVEHSPNNPSALLMLGRLLNRLNRSDEALPHIQRAVELEPNAADAAEFYFAVLSSLGRLEEAETLIDTSPNIANRSRLFSSLGQSYRQAGDIASAEATDRRAIELYPDVPVHRADLMNLLIDNGDHAAAAQVALETIRHFGLSIEINGQNVPIYLWLHAAADGITDANRDEITEVITAAAEEDGSASAMRTLGQYHSEFGDEELAIEALRRAWDLDDSSGNRLRVIRLELNSERLETALGLMSEHVAEYPDALEMRLWRGIALARHGEIEQAKSEWNAALETVDTFPLTEVLQTLGALHSEGWSSEGIALALTLIEHQGLFLERADQPPLALYDLLMLFEDDIPDHEAEIEPVLTAATGEAPSAEALVILGRFYAANGRFDEASQAFLSAMDLMPDNIELAVQISEWCADFEMYDIAASVIESAISSTSEESDLLQYQLGYVYDSADRPEEAERALRRAIEINPENYFALNHLGYMFTEENTNLEEALELTQRAVELSDRDTVNGFNNGFIVDSLGWAHYRLGNSAEAVEWLQEAIRRSASDGIQDGLFFEHLGDALLIDGRGPEAIEAWEQAFNLYRSDEDVESALSVADKILSEQPDNPSIAGAVEEIRAEETGAEQD